MHRYFIKTPWWVKRLFSTYVWSLPAEGKKVFLTFDDGPHPTITPWVMQVLKQHNARATFFCVGNNVVHYQAVYQQILAAGHAVGNHTHQHPNGWKTNTGSYLKDVATAAQYIDSALFRPPYGRIKKEQAKALQKKGVHIIMWDVLSGDFDVTITPQQCLKNVLSNTVAGSVIVFHDSVKAESNLRYALPKVLEAFSHEGYRFEKIDATSLKKLGPG